MNSVRRRFLIALPVALAALAATTTLAAGRAKLHVPSPEWRDQIVYFVMTDRFADGDVRNNDFGAGEFDPRSGSKYNGGDLRGLTDKLDYIRGLGATAVWLTPPVANQWTDPLTDYTGYHGYWAEHFGKVDRHLGTLADYQRLSRELHRRDMVLVQDIVVNHTGNFFAYRGGWDAADPTRFYLRNRGSRPVTAPSQAPFHLNDPRRAADRRAGIYHWTPDVADFTDPHQELSFQMAGLDDLNTDSRTVRRALRRSFGHWIRAAGVDAFRVDTAFFVPPELFVDFLHARDPQAPGIAEVARRTGRRQFHVFGEGFGIDKPYANEQARKIERYMTGPDGKPVLPGMLNFPLYGALGDVFARGRPTAELGDRIEQMMKLHARPQLMPSFVDNHDLDRFLSGGSMAGLQQALLAIFTLPGIPTIYYGTEQGFTEQRGAMFAAGFGSGGRDRFDTTTPLYRQIARLSALRRAHKLFSRGTPQVLSANPAAAGALAWRMSHGDEAALVVFNSSDTETLLDNLDLGAPAGSRLPALFGLQGLPADLLVGANRRIALKLPPGAGMVWRLDAQRSTAAAGTVSTTASTAASTTATASDPTAPAVSIDELPGARFDGDFMLAGTAPGLVSFKLVVDGDLANASTVTPDAGGRWRASVDTARMVDAAITHRLVAWDESTGVASAARSFRVDRPWAVLANIEDPAGDDHGPRGTYLYPTDPGWGNHRQMDLRRIKVSGAGGALRLDLGMNKVTTGWNPRNGFDRVAFTVYIQLPDRPGGASVMPMQNASLPAGMRWHYRLRVTGWANALFSAEGASATNEGTLAAPAAQIAVDRLTNTVTLTLAPTSLGRPATLSGARVYVTTWDYDGGYRALMPQPQAYTVGGGDPATDARVMDDSPAITLP